MTTLAVELLRVLGDESGQAMTPDSLSRVLVAIGFNPPASTTEIIVALDSLLADGWVEAVHSARLGVRYRIMRTRPGVDMSETRLGAA